MKRHLSYLRLCITIAILFIAQSGLILAVSARSARTLNAAPASLITPTTIPAPVLPSNVEPVPPHSPEHRIYVPLVLQPGVPTATTPEWLHLVNAYRQQAGVPPVAADNTLSSNCWEHARYMAEHDHLTHYQNPELPWASVAGEQCANKGNAWMGSAFSHPVWSIQSSMDSWMESVGHRLWLLYPTTPTFGYGFYTAANNRSGAALDVLSRAHMAADTRYTSWPVRYPASDQIGIPAQRYPITLQWPYFEATPTLHTVRLHTANGTAIAHTADTALPVGHKGVQIIPTQPLPPDTIVVVTVTGTYTDVPFTYTWQFTTGHADT